ncbi:MAG: hypothetical protein A2W98_10345 [Bacteroidetes bacterium GWF2_33_38]|nr:MAG: hypothetical protein A2W98_10345 [Bacteroidetes bacterium GWF2_33_38]OFY73019.1 MAG: hypothetical protein A2265_04870 [Bacteroidetes bacterium RIFOXYA12_FULL_33_9]OFY85425.1 MAG: hypothetical protein A2236_01510 [Bacteroidetes bacterium RIFOXYA2_FULL_33_7]
MLAPIARSFRIISSFFNPLSFHSKAFFSFLPSSFNTIFLVPFILITSYPCGGWVTHIPFFSFSTIPATAFCLRS